MTILILFALGIATTALFLAQENDKKRQKRSNQEHSTTIIDKQSQKECEKLELKRLELPYLNEQISNLELQLSLLGDLDELQRDKYYLSDERGLAKVLRTTKQLTQTQKQLATLRLKKERILHELRRH